MSSECPVCSDTKLLLSNPCPLCCDEPIEDHQESASEDRDHCSEVAAASAEDAEKQRQNGSAQGDGSYWCDLCQKDLQSAVSWAGHVKGRKHLYRQGSRPASRLSRALQAALSEEQLFERLARGDFKQIVVCTGAGVSTAAGIPDFRSPGGMFDLIHSMWGDRFPVVWQSPETLLSRHFVRSHPEEWANDVEPWLRNLKWCDARPTATHRFCSWLHQQGWLRRIYTQNVDGLHVHPDLALPPEMVVECHGALRDGSIVMYGDPLPSRFDEALRMDFPKVPGRVNVDLFLVFGTSLQVAPFCGIPNMAPRDCVRVLVNREISACMTNSFCRSRVQSYYDSFDLGGHSFALATARMGDWRDVSLKPLWQDRKANRRWQQLLVESDSDEFVQRFFSSPEACRRALDLNQS